MSDIDLSNVNRLYTVLLLESGPRHGYGVIKDIEEITGNRPSTSHIYPFLDELRSEGLVTVEEGDDRKVYSLTEEGEELVKEQLEAFGEILTSAIEGEVKECSNCTCRIYDGGYEENDEVFCCRHCAEASEK